MQDNEQVTNNAREIRRLIAATMDGVTAEKMRQNGIGYAKNFGVALPRLREIAAQFQPDALLAAALWQTGSRESMIAALLLTPPNSLTLAEAAQLTEKLATRICGADGGKRRTKRAVCGHLHRHTRRRSVERYAIEMVGTKNRRQRPRYGYRQRRHYPIHAPRRDAAAPKLRRKRHQHAAAVAKRTLPTYGRLAIVLKISGYKSA